MLPRFAPSDFLSGNSTLTFSVERVISQNLLNGLGRMESYQGPFHMSPVDRAGPVSEIEGMNYVGGEYYLGGEFTGYYSKQTQTVHVASLRFIPCFGDAGSRFILRKICFYGSSKF